MNNFCGHSQYDSLAIFWTSITPNAKFSAVLKNKGLENCLEKPEMLLKVVTPISDYAFNFIDK